MRPPQPGRPAKDLGTMIERSQNANPPPSRSFRTTQWSLVVAASSDSPEALGELCAAYWPPLHAYLRRLGYAAVEAEDLTQAFFTRLLDKRLLGAADQRRGRFRTFLLTALRRFAVNEWKHMGAAKRGGGVRHVALDERSGEMAEAAEVSHDLTPDRLFERQWALVVLRRAWNALEAEQREASKTVTFQALAPCLTPGASPDNYEQLAERLDSTPAALRMAVSRLRLRLGELVRAEIRTTVDSDAEVDDEVRDLFRALQA